LNLKHNEKGWSEIALDSWLLGAEAWTVMALRTARLMQGGSEGCVEAKLMVNEKVDSCLELGAHAAAGRLGNTPKAVTGSVVSHYLGAVRANRKRLLGG
jgi:hypothetical protein